MIDPSSSHGLARASFSPSAPRGSSNGAAKARGPAGAESDELTQTEKEQVKKLKERDSEVRAHEMAHLAAAGSLARGGPSYVYQTGPDGKSYAVGGSVKIDTAPGRTPEETARKAALIRAAALAPSDPSPQDLQVAAQASSMAASAKTERGDPRQAEEARAVGFKAGAPAGITSARRLEKSASASGHEAPLAGIPALARAYASSSADAEDRPRLAASA